MKTFEQFSESVAMLSESPASDSVANAVGKLALLLDRESEKFTKTAPQILLL